MCELYILLAFGLGLFSGWFANFLLSKLYIEKAIDRGYSKEEQEEIRSELHKESKNFKLSTAFFVLFMFAIFMFLAYVLTINPPKNEATKAIDKADNAAVFDSLVDSMRKFSR